MALVIDLFSKEVRQIGEAVSFPLSTAPSAVTKEDVPSNQRSWLI